MIIESSAESSKLFKSSRLRTIRVALVGKTIPQRIFRLYLLAIIIGAALLFTPIALKNGYQMFTIDDYETKS
jgi:H+/Cl- antiporter ClcA